MRIVIATDKFKGSLSADQVASAIARGIAEELDATYDLAPIADGGEGTAALIGAARNATRIEVTASDALGRPVPCAYSWLAEEAEACLDTSEPCGLWRIASGERNILESDSRGLGELMRDAIGRGAKGLIICLGGSATNDAGAGFAHALGWRFLDETGAELSPTPSNFMRCRAMVPPSQPLAVEVLALADVTSPLLGPEGATHTFSRQKGAREEDVPALESALRHFADLVEATTGRTARDLPGAGAAGGLGFGLATFCGAQIEPGFPTVAKLIGLEDRIRDADLVITGEGCLDSQSIQGKGPYRVAGMARALGKPVIALAGKIEPAAEAHFDGALAIQEGPMSLDESVANAETLLSRAARRAARLLKINL